MKQNSWWPHEHFDFSSKKRKQGTWNTPRSKQKNKLSVKTFIFYFKKAQNKQTRHTPKNTSCDVLWRNCCCHRSSSMLWRHRIVRSRSCPCLSRIVQHIFIDPCGFTQILDSFFSFTRPPQKGRMHTTVHFFETTKDIKIPANEREKKYLLYSI